MTELRVWGRFAPQSWWLTASCPVPCVWVTEISSEGVTRLFHMSCWLPAPGLLSDSKQALRRNTQGSMCLWRCRRLASSACGKPAALPVTSHLLPSNLLEAAKCVF